jgi:hypothetical protein
VRVGHEIFRGRWTELIGTEMIVGQEGDDGTSLGDANDTEGKVIGMTRRRLIMERVILKRKAEEIGKTGR